MTAFNVKSGKMDDGLLMHQINRAVMKSKLEWCVIILTSNSHEVKIDDKKLFFVRIR